MKSLMETLWELLKFWKKSKNKLKEGIDFKFYDFADSDLRGIVFLTGEYADVLFYYTNASIAEEGMGARLKFGYQVVKSGKHTREALQIDDKFVTMLGDLLTDIILMDGKFESPRTFYSEESNL